MFSPAEVELGIIDEMVNFSHTITYYDELSMETADVVITSLQPLEEPSTVIISGNTISGYYRDSFEDNMMYRTPNNQFISTKKFEQINVADLSEMISYKANLSRQKIFSYRADAYINNILVGTTTYIKTITRNWTPGMMLLKEYVNASSKSFE